MRPITWPSIDQRMPYQFDVFDTTLSNTFKTQFALPLSFADFSATFQQRFNAYADGQLKALAGEGAGQAVSARRRLQPAAAQHARRWTISRR